MSDTVKIFAWTHVRKGSLESFSCRIKGVRLTWKSKWEKKVDPKTVIPLTAYGQQMCRRGPADQISTAGGLVLSPAVPSIRQAASILSKPLKNLWRPVWRTHSKQFLALRTPPFFIHLAEIMARCRGLRKVSYCFGVQDVLCCVVSCRVVCMHQAVT